MPKGVYNRSKGLQTQVVNEAPRPEAANVQAVQVVRQTDSEDLMSTTDKLFGTVAERQEEEKEQESLEPIVQNPLVEPEQPEKVQEEAPAPVPAQPTPEEAPKPIKTSVETPQDEILDLDTFGSRKVKAVIDGREEILPFKEVLGQYQLKKHWSEAADRVGEERRKLAEERRQLTELRQNQSSMNVPRGNEEQANGQINGVQQPDPYLQRIQFLEQQLNQVVEGTRPAMYESNRQRVSQELKSQGFNDFLDYIPKMESHIVGIQDPQLVQFYDTPMGAKSLYFQLKAQELQATPAKAPPAPAPVRQSAPQIVPQTRVDSGSQPSSGLNDDSASNYRKAFQRASMLRDDKDAWNAVLQQKGIIPE